MSSHTVPVRWWARAASAARRPALPNSARPTPAFRAALAALAVLAFPALPMPGGAAHAAPREVRTCEAAKLTDAEVIVRGTVRGWESPNEEIANFVLADGCGVITVEVSGVVQCRPGTPVAVQGVIENEGTALLVADTVVCG